VREVGNMKVERKRRRRIRSKGQTRDDVLFRVI
jgi:hypothetical protein